MLNHIYRILIRALISALMSVSVSVAMTVGDKASDSSLVVASGRSNLDYFQPANNGNEILDVDEAFKFNLTTDAKHLILRWQVTNGYYLYRDKIKVFVDNQQYPIQLPDGEAKEDPLFGHVEVYYRDIQTMLPFTSIDRTDGKQLQVHYQGCAEIGVCYPPQRQTFSLKDFFFPIVNAATKEPDSVTNNQTFIGGGDSNDLSESDLITAQLVNRASWFTLLIFFVAGLLLTFTPCAFPLVPILSGILAQQGEKNNIKHSFSTSVIYVLSMSVTYAMMGTFTGLIGKNLQAVLQNPWVLGLFALIFVLLALSMFGFYPLQLPLSWQNKINKLSAPKNNHGTSSRFHIIVMGLLSALMMGPCMTPALAGALVYIGQSGDVLKGGLSLFAMGIGMGIPLIIMGTFVGRFLPQAGAWMETIKITFGVFMLALSIYFLDRFIPVWLSMVLWAALLIISAIYMGALESINRQSSKWHTLYKGIAWLLMIPGILLLVGVASGGRSLLQPLEHLTNNVQLGLGYNLPSDAKGFFQPAEAGDDIANKLAQAKQKQQPVLLYVTAKWCITCRELEHLTFSDTQVISAMQTALSYQVDVTKDSQRNEKFMHSIGIFGPPAILFFDRNGNEIRRYRSVGFIDAEDLLQRMNDWKS